MHFKDKWNFRECENMNSELFVCCTKLGYDLEIKHELSVYIVYVSKAFNMRTKLTCKRDPGRKRTPFQLQII